MSRIKISRDLRKKAHIVAAVHSLGALRFARKIQHGEVDFLEIRVDNFADDPAPLLATLPKLRVPLLVTVRHPAEGGAHRLGFAERQDLFARFLPFASFIDIELRSWEKMAGTIEAARRAGVKIVASTHNFRTTPSEPALRQAIRLAHAAGADICKIAAVANHPAALARLLGLLARNQPLPLSVMAMGRFGKISRLLFAQAGSALNYGYLDSPNAHGQWEARLLKKRLAELAES
jgi:3-dehydroquinate dehydratase-1